MMNISSSKSWLRWTRGVVLVLVLVGSLHRSEAREEWQVRSQNRWTYIAQRLQRDYLASPRPGYTLQRLLRHYQKKGGYQTLLLVLPQTALQQKPKPVPKDRLSLALGLLAIQANDTPRAIVLLQGLLSPPLRKFLTVRESGPVSSQIHPDTAVFPGKTPSAVFSWVRSLPILQRQLLLYWAQLHFQAQNWQQARRAYQLLLAAADTPKQQYTWIQKLLWMDEKDARWESVRQHYQFLSAYRPKHPEYRERLAQVFLRLERPLDALQQLEVAEKLVSSSKRPTLWLQRVQILQRLQRYSQTLELLQRIRRSLVPHHWMQRTCIDLEIQLYRQQKKLPALLEIYQQRARSQPRLYLPFLPILFTELGQHRQAMQSYRMLLKKYPSSSILQDFVLFLHQRQHYEEANRLLRTQLVKAPKDSRWALLLLQTYHLAKQYEVRDLGIQQFLQTYERDSFFLHALHRHAERWALAAPLQQLIYQKLCPLPPQSAHCYERWGALLWQQQQRQMAFEVWGKIAQIQPVVAQNQWVLAQIYYKHGQLWQSQALLEKLVRMQSPLRRAQTLLSEIYLRQRQPEQAMKWLQSALNQTSQMTERQKIREDMLRALSQQYHYSLVWDILRRNYWLQPFSVESHKQILLYFVRYPHHFRVPRYGRYYTRRYPRVHSRWGAYYRRRRLLYNATSYQTPIPSEIHRIVSDGLLIAPKDPELYHLAVQVYRHDPKSLRYLRRLLELDSTQLEQNLRLYQQQAHRWNQSKQILPLFQALSQKYPYHAVVWGQLAQQALQQKNWVLAQEAYQKAQQLDKKPFAYACGLAQTYAHQQQWRKAWQSLRKHQSTMSPAQQELGLLLQIRYGLMLGYTPPVLLARLQQQLPPGEGQTWLAFTLWKHHAASLSLQERNFFAYAMQQTRQDWSRDLEQFTSADRRYRAYLLLHHLDKDGFLAKMPSLFQDPHPPIRMMGAFAIALYQQQTRFAVLDQLERADTHAGVRHAARFAISVLLQQWRFSSLDHTLPAELWHGLILPGVPISKYPEYQMLQHISRQYRWSPPYLRRHIFSRLYQIPVAGVNILNRMLELSQHRCFAFAALHALRSPQSPQILRQSALELSIPKAFFYAHCRQQNLSPPPDLFVPEQCVSSRQ